MKKMKYASNKTGRPLKHSKEIEYAHEDMVQHTRLCGTKACSFVVNWLTVFQRCVSCVNFHSKDKTNFFRVPEGCVFSVLSFNHRDMYVVFSLLVSVCMNLHFLCLYSFYYMVYISCLHVFFSLFVYFLWAICCGHWPYYKLNVFSVIKHFI